MEYKSSSFKELFDTLSNDRYVLKYSNYFEVYDTFFNKFLDYEKVRVLEIGLLDGGSIELWKRYFGEKLEFYGMDINPDCKLYEEKNVNIYIGSQSDEVFLNSFVKNVPHFDIVIDDGGHTMKQQITSFNYLFNHLNDQGIYLCEDTHTSYSYTYGGGLKRKSSFIEFSKDLIDKLYSWHNDKNVTIEYYTENISGIHFYDGIVVFEKKIRSKPEVLHVGKFSNKHELYQKNQKSKLFYIFHKFTNKTLSFFGFDGYDYAYWD